MKSAPIRVLCVDDHPILLEGLRSRLALEQNMTFVGGLPSAEGLVDAARDNGADVVILDVALEGRDPFEAVEDLRRALPAVRVIFLSAYVRDRYVDAAFRCGAWGYMYKGDGLEAIVDAVRRVARGEYVFGPRILERCRVDPALSPGRIATAPSRLQTLTRREVEILRLIGRGMSRQEIARTMHRSVKTVDTHRATIMKKLDIHDRTELALFAHREGLAEG